MADNRFFRDSSSRLMFCMDQVPGDSYPTISKEIITAFRLERHTDLITDFAAVIFQDYRRAEQIVGLEWDNWMGFTVTAKTPDSEPLVREIAAWLLQSSWASKS